jgi:hypothetical protein
MSVSISDPIVFTQDSVLAKTFPGLSEKFVVDFANGIEVVHDHVRVQRNHNNSFFSRLIDGFTGQGARRQAEINTSLADGVEGSLRWLTELTESVARSNLALCLINEHIGILQDNVALLAHYSADSRIMLENLEHNLSSRCDVLGAEIARIDFEQRAGRQLGQVFDKWAAGGYAGLSRLARLYAALDELYWGDFGSFCRANDNSVRRDFLRQLAHKATAQMEADLRLDAGQRVELRTLLAPVGRSALTEVNEALAYLGNWTNSEDHPFAFVATQPIEDRLPNTIPRLMNSERAAEAMTREMFEDRNHG